MQSIIKGYNGNSNLKKVNQSIEWTKELLEEYIKCKEDIIYFVETYMKIVHVDKGLISFKLYDYQKEMLLDMQKHRFNAFCLSRQSGKSVTVCAFILWYILFNEEKEIGILANKGDTAREILGRIQLAYQHLPKWLTQGIVTWNKGSFVLENGAKVLAAATSSDNVRGHSFALVYLDEVAFVENYDDFYSSVYPTISSGETTQIIMTSTPNGLNHFHKTISMGLKKENDFNVRIVPWHQVPGRDEKWKEKTLKTLNYDYQKFDQEFNVEFLGSSGTLISGSTLKRLVAQVPLAASEGISQFVRPKVGHTYVLTADVSHGKAQDYSAIQVIDVTQMPYQQVLTFRDNMTGPGDFAEIIHRIGNQYNKAWVLIEVNDMGQQVAETLYVDYEYENMMLSESAGVKGKRITLTYTGNNTDRGIRTTKIVKSVGCSMLKLLVEQDQLIINDHDTIEELSTFSKKGTSYEAEPGNNDDLVMCLVIFAWLTEQKFFKDMTDIHTLLKLKEKSTTQIESEMLPFGYLVTGEENHIDDLPSDKRDNWMIVNTQGTAEEEKPDFWTYNPKHWSRF